MERRQSEIKNRITKIVAMRSISTVFSSLLLIIIISFTFPKVILYDNFATYQILMTIFLITLLARFLSAKKISSEVYSKWHEYTLNLSIVLNSALWGICCALVFATQNESIEGITAVICAAGLASSGLVSLTASRRLMILHFLGVLGPVILSRFFIDSKFNDILTIITLVYGLFLTLLSVTSNKQVVRSIENELKLEERTQELIDSRNEAINNLSNKTEFIANLSHEIRTPLNGIMGSIQLLEEEKLSSDGLENLRILNVSSRNLLDLVNEILDSSKLEAGKYEIRNSKVDLTKLIEEVYVMYKSLADQAHLVYELEVQSDLKSKLVFTDTMKLKQVLSNLISNAIKYTKKGQVKIFLSLVNESDKDLIVKFCVEDTGEGLKAEELEKLFNPYSQIDRNSKNVKGTGLGLYLSSEIIKRLGSEINVQSEYGKYTSFSFELKMQKVKKEEVDFIKLDDILKNNFQSNTRVLIVDDNEINLILLEKILKKMHIHPLKASTGKEAIEIFLNEKVDIVFTDINLLDMNGFDLIKDLKMINPEFDNFYACSGNVTENNVNEYLSAGFKGALGKPINFEKIKSIVEKKAA